MSSAGQTPQQQLAAVAPSGGGASASGGQSNPASAAAAVAAAAHAAAVANQHQQQGSGGSNATTGALGGGAPSAYPNLLPNFPAGFPGFSPSAIPFFLQQHAAAAQAAQAGAAGASSPATPAAKGGAAKKQKGATGAAVTPGQPAGSGMLLSPAAAAAASPYASFLGSYNALAAAAGGLPFPDVSSLAAGAAGAVGGAGAGGAMGVGVPRGRWTEEMTIKLIELRTKMDARFRTVARPDRLWAEITQQITSQFQAHLPKQSTKDKWKNLRSSYRLINQGKHPSHYTKDTWPFFHLLEQYTRVKQEHDSKHPNPVSLQLNAPGGGAGNDVSSIQGMHDDSDDDGGDGGDGEGDEDDDEDDDGTDTPSKGGKGGAKLSGKKRPRGASSGAAAAVAAAAQAAAASGYGGSAYSAAQGQHAINQLGAMSPELLSLLRPKDVTRKERDWATVIRSMTGALTQNIQESHQQLIVLTHAVRDVAEKMAPSAATRRVKLETSAAHAVRMAEVSLEVDVVRADIRHLPLLLPLMDAYRSFHAQTQDPEKLEEFLRDKLINQRTVIFLALPVTGAQAAQGVDKNAQNQQIPPSAAQAGGSAGGDPSISAHENAVANSLTSTHSLVSGSASTHTSHGGAAASRLRGHLPAYAVGFAQLQPTWSTLRLSRSWEVADLFVSPGSRNRGVASLLLQHARRFAIDSGAAQIDLHTSVHNNAMQRMFARQEFMKQLDGATFTFNIKERGEM